MQNQADPAHRLSFSLISSSSHTSNTLNQYYSQRFTQRESRQSFWGPIITRSLIDCYGWLSITTRQHHRDSYNRRICVRTINIIKVLINDAKYLLSLVEKGVIPLEHVLSVCETTVRWFELSSTQITDTGTAASENFTADFERLIARKNVLLHLLESKVRSCVKCPLESSGLSYTVTE